jgi:hypothetical protein
MMDDLLYTQEDIDEWIRTCEELQERNRELEQEIAEYKDKIEQGTLVELPCKVGDTIYVIPHLWDRKGIFVGEIDKRKADAFYVIGEFVDIEDDILGEFYRVGVEVFLTREEAEKRLKELQNGF